MQHYLHFSNYIIIILQNNRITILLKKYINILFVLIEIHFIKNKYKYDILLFINS